MGETILGWSLHRKQTVIYSKQNSIPSRDRQRYLGHHMCYDIPQWLAEIIAKLRVLNTLEKNTIEFHFTIAKFSNLKFIIYMCVDCCLGEKKGYGLWISVICATVMVNQLIMPNLKRNCHSSTNLKGEVSCAKLTIGC